MSVIWVQMIVGAKREPFLEAALRSVAWVDGFAIVNTAPDTENGQENERIIRSVIPPEKLRIGHVWMDPMDFSKARNLSLDMIEDGDWALILDSDDVHYPEMEAEARRLSVAVCDIATFHFYHLAVFKDLLHSVRHREILFRKTPGVRFEGGVHELLSHPRKYPVLGETRYVHYGYVRPAREVAERWEMYRALGATIHDYDASDPDHALDAWPAICQPMFAEHPPAVRELLASYPSAPKEPIALPCRVGLVLLTWNDAENLRKCLASLATTTEPFNLLVVDNGSTDGSVDLINRWADESRPDGCLCEHGVHPGLSLAQALNHGFGVHMRDPEIDYIGWVHPDHVFEHADWLTELREAMDAHPEYAKLGAEEVQLVGAGLRSGNSQCFIIRKTALETIGLFDERFRGIGGREDWDMNKRLLEVGQVMIWPDAIVRHVGMATRSRHDTDADGRANAEYYAHKWGTDDQPV